MAAQNNFRYIIVGAQLGTKGARLAKLRNHLIIADDAKNAPNGTNVPARFAPGRKPEAY